MIVPWAQSASSGEASQDSSATAAASRGRPSRSSARASSGHEQGVLLRRALVATQPLHAREVLPGDEQARQFGHHCGMVGHRGEQRRQCFPGLPELAADAQLQRPAQAHALLGTERRGGALVRRGRLGLVRAAHDDEPGGHLPDPELLRVQTLKVADDDGRVRALRARGGRKRAGRERGRRQAEERGQDDAEPPARGRGRHRGLPLPFSARR